MRHIGTPLTLLFVGALTAQSGEFTVYPNGYIYSEALHGPYRTTSWIR
ncbi:MAG: hypothetical protein IPO05_18555 [Flavobacteriales bacterium]|nr:hypothetical protein [Flavobacteriales bacterium]